MTSKSDINSTTVAFGATTKVNPQRSNRGEESSDDDSHSIKSSAGIEHKNKEKVDPNIMKLVSRLHNAEQKINEFKSDIEGTDKGGYKNNKKEFHANTDTLITNLKAGPVSNHPKIKEEVHTGVEVRILNMAEQIERQKREIEELKQVIKSKNEYIVSIQTDYKKYKNLYTEQLNESKRLQALLKDRDHDLSKKHRETNLDGQVIDFKENLRKEQIDKKPSSSKQVKDHTSDPYNFWRTTNEPVEAQTNKQEPSKLDEILGNNNLWVDASIPDTYNGLGFSTIEQKLQNTGVRTKKY